MRRNRHCGGSKRAESPEADTAFTEVHNRSAWEDAFVDALCEPPETFVFGDGTFAHVITFNLYRGMLAIEALRHLGVTVVGCPEGYLANGEVSGATENGIAAIQRRCRAGSRHRYVDEGACR